MEGEFFSYFLQPLAANTYTVFLNCTLECGSCEESFNITMQTCLSTPGNAFGDSFELTPGICLGGYPGSAPASNAVSLLVSPTYVCINTSVTVYNFGNNTSCTKWDNSYAQVSPNSNSTLWTVKLACSDSACATCNFVATNVSLTECVEITFEAPATLQLMSTKTLPACPLPPPSAPVVLTSYFAPDYVGTNT